MLAHFLLAKPPRTHNTHSGAGTPTLGQRGAPAERKKFGGPRPKRKHRPLLLAFVSGTRHQRSVLCSITKATIAPCRAHCNVSPINPEESSSYIYKAAVISFLSSLSAAPQYSLESTASGPLAPRDKVGTTYYLVGVTRLWIWPFIQRSRRPEPGLRRVFAT